MLRRLEDSAQIARIDPVAAFTYLNNKPGHVWQLGSAFFTKWLYFASAQGGQHTPSAAPALDELVQGWLRRRAGLALDSRNTSSYQQYLEPLSEWGEPYKRTPAQVEETIFLLVRAEQAAVRSDQE